MPKAKQLEVPWKVKSRADVDAHDSPNVSHREPRRLVKFMDEPEDAKACLHDSGGSEPHGPDHARGAVRLRRALLCAAPLAGQGRLPHLRAQRRCLSTCANPPTDT